MRLVLRRFGRMLRSRGIIAVPIVVMAVTGSYFAARHLEPFLGAVAPNAAKVDRRVSAVTPKLDIRPPEVPVVRSIPADLPRVSAPPGVSAAVPAPPARPPEADIAQAEAERKLARSRQAAQHQLAARRLRAARRKAAGVEDVSAISVGRGAYALVSEARRYIGTNPTKRATLWCARFINFVLDRTGHNGTGSDAALSFARYGRRVPGPRIGAIAVMRRKGGGHVGIVSGIDRHGNPILISGNSIVLTDLRGRRRGVAEAVYPRKRIIAYVMPNR